MNTEYQQVTGFLQQSQRIDAAKYDETFLNKSLQKRMTETGCGTLEEYYALLKESAGEAEQFSSALHINYSEFFRNSLTYAVLERIVLPSVVLKNRETKRKEVRIWSAACACGQEAYSIAMLLGEMKHGESEKPKCRIFATDQSENQISEARKGQYQAAALNNVSLMRAQQWFDKQADTWCIKQELKENIDFSVFDLFDPELSSPQTSIFGDFDIVICANLLFYYKPGYRREIIDKLSGCLAPHGYFVTGEAEREILAGSGFTEVFPYSAIFRA